MRSTLLKFGVVAFALLSLVPDSRADEAVQPSADAVAARAFELMAGPSWEKARYIAFTFGVQREGKIVASYAQRLDRYTGDYRVSGRNREGKDFIVVMNINTKAGRGWLDGVEVSDPKDLLVTGYRRYINDTYWLLMPLKLRDPGVRLESAGQVTDGSRVIDVLRLNFDQGVGLTSGDQYWVGIDRETGMAVTWEMKLQNSKPDEPNGKFNLRKYERRGGLLLSTVKEAADGKSQIMLTDVTVSSEVPKDAFR